MSSQELAKGYEPADVEKRWIAYWEEKKSFCPDPKKAGRRYSIVIPPPNVTGSLHMGHALNLTLQDILCRHQRQLGANVLWVPGTDHAGIATQNVVERQLATEGKSRDDLGRAAFIERVWEWKNEYGDKILNQVRRIGASVDWSRLRFTMDEGLSRAVREVFVCLYEEDLIYQGDYIINWCPRCHTALADIEVEHEDVPGGLYQMSYPLADGSGTLTIATTRPETMFGDTAVAVHPEDERYQSVIGKEVLLPLTDRRIPVIADSYVDMEFGTGCLKVTPAHDMNDFEIGRRHNLPVLQVIDGQGIMTAEAGPDFAGLDRFACRKKTLEALKEKGFLLHSEDYSHSVGHCYRCRTAIEPYVSRQWFVATAKLAERAKAAVQNGNTRILPAQWEKTYYEWLDNIRDWCISRQIWWGHRIPAWNCQDCGKLTVARQDPATCPHCQSTKLRQDPDVLDTWFSSALWPFSTLGWPDKTPELAAFYPTSSLVTGFDILFFWVARMMMMGLHFMDKVPFDDVYIHALVRDENGQKMSKSKGNVIDPLLMIDKYGTDAFRFTLTAFAAMGRDIKMAEKRIEGYRHFINKIWNAARFALMNISGAEPALDEKTSLPLHHRWILHRLEETRESTARALQEYRFNDVAQGLYTFVWHEFCDWYLELIKPELYGEDEAQKEAARACLLMVLREVLILLYPVIPFVTQEIWEKIAPKNQEDLAKVAFPSARPQCLDENVARRMNLLQQVIVSIRNIRAELGIAPGRRLEVLLQAKAKDHAFLQEHTVEILNLARLTDLRVDTKIDAPHGCATSVVEGNEIFVPLEGIIDFQDEIGRLGKELAKLNKELEFCAKKLGNPAFVDKAPADVVQKERDKAEGLNLNREKLLALRERLAAYLHS